jgi:hypothetical protein
MPITIKQFLTVHLFATEKATADIGLDSGTCTPHSFMRLFGNYCGPLCALILFIALHKNFCCRAQAAFVEEGFQRSQKHGVFFLDPLKKYKLKQFQNASR